MHTNLWIQGNRHSGKTLALLLMAEICRDLGLYDEKQPNTVADLTIPELHKALRAYEVANPIPVLDEATVAALNAEYGIPEDPLPPIHAGLTYPLDRKYLDFLARNLTRAIEALGTEADPFAELEQHFQDLRRFAHRFQRTDQELIETILAFSRLPGLPTPQLIAAVRTSLEAATVAETSGPKNPLAATAQAEATTAHQEPGSTLAGIRYTSEQGICAILALARSRAATGSIPPSFVKEVEAIVFRSNKVEP